VPLSISGTVQERKRVPVILQRIPVFFLVVALAVAATETAAAQHAPTLDLPPGIARQAEPLLEDMLAHMQQMGMSAEQMMPMMQALADQLPPGIFLQILQLAPSLAMPDMMLLHHSLHDGDLLQQPPGQILRFVRELAS
jgi:hypothetical protein